MPVLHNPNPTKKLEITIGNTTYVRYPVKTPLIFVSDDLLGVIKQETYGFLQEGDVILIAESVVAIAQGRAYKIDEIQYGFSAKLLSRFVTKTPAGIGLGIPQTMHLALQEVGYLRMYVAAALAAATKPFGIRGMFYRIAGSKARAIDGPTPGTQPPFNQYASLSPKNPRQYAVSVEQALDKDVQVIIVDANDLGVNILGARDKEQEMLGQALTADNPMGQGTEGTPLMIVRKKA